MAAIQLVYVEIKDDFKNVTHIHPAYHCSFDPQSGWSKYVVSEKYFEPAVYILAIEAAFIQIV